MNTNFDLSVQILATLKNIQVENLIICAGARNAPLVLALQKLMKDNPQEYSFKITSFFEERSAAFYALGLIRATGLPVAVITTSGTAAAELLPATIEAFYQNLPLILITADRPKSFRKSGAPQAIEQVGLFSNYAQTQFDLDVKDLYFRSQEISQSTDLKKPIHFNVCFDEPLIDSISENFKLVHLLNLQKIQPDHFSFELQLKNFVQLKSPLMIVGDVPSMFRAIIKKRLLAWKSLVYFESLSDLRDDPDLQHLRIQSLEPCFKQAFKDQVFDSVVRIGSVPTLRLWRDLESELLEIPVLNFTAQEFSGLARTSLTVSLDFLALEASVDLISKADEMNREKIKSVRQKDFELTEFKKKLIQKYPSSEPSIIFHLSNFFKSWPTYLGNSMPIRLWDLVALGQPDIKKFANRGANGIDGQISSYLGWSCQFEKSCALVGDLTALYDLAGLGLVHLGPPSKKVLFISNNQGGRIFDRVFKGNPIFLNSQKVDFSSWAKLWNVSYFKIRTPEELKDFSKKLDLEFDKDTTIVELEVNLEESHLFWNEWDNECKNVKF